MEYEICIISCFISCFFHVSFHVKFGYIGSCNFSINNLQNTCLVTRLLKWNMYYILSQIIYKKNRVKESKLNVYFYFLIKGAFYGTVICGMRNLRVWYGPLPELVCIAQAKMTQAVLTFAVVGLVMVIITKFVFICVWRSMRSIDDNLLKRIALNEIILLCFLHSWCWPQSNSAGSEVCTITLNKLLLVEMLIFENWSDNL